VKKPIGLEAGRADDDEAISRLTAREEAARLCSESVSNHQVLAFSDHAMRSRTCH
jgi:hypothetical protein